GERDPGHARAAIAGRLGDEQDRRAGALVEVALEPLAEERRPLAPAVEVERRADLGRREPRDYSRTVDGVRPKPDPSHSHSIVAGGFDVTSRTTRLTSGISLTMREATSSTSSYGRRAQSAVIASSEVTARIAIG